MRRTNPLTIKKIENLANKLRKALNIKPYAPFPILDVIESLSTNGLLTIQYLENDDPMFIDGALAKYNPIDDFIYIKESALEKLECGEYQVNFTLAHELFHWFQCRVLEFEFEEVDKCPSYADPEWQANEFAAQLLLPTKSIICNKNQTSILAEIYKITESCVVTRKLYYQRRIKRKKTNKS